MHEHEERCCADFAEFFVFIFYVLLKKLYHPLWFLIFFSAENLLQFFIIST